MVTGMEVCFSRNIANSREAYSEITNLASGKQTQAFVLQYLHIKLAENAPSVAVPPY